MGKANQAISMLRIEMAWSFHKAKLTVSAGFLSDSAPVRISEDSSHSSGETVA